MSMTDPIADMLTRIRNACGSKHRRVDMPASKMKLEIARMLKENNFIRTIKTVAAADGRPLLRVRAQVRAGRTAGHPRAAARLDPRTAQVRRRGRDSARAQRPRAWRSSAPRKGLMTDREARATAHRRRTSRSRLVRRPTMSRIGKIPIQIPKGVTVTVKGQRVTVKGPKGELHRERAPGHRRGGRTATIVTVSRPSDEPSHKSLHGLSRTLVANMVEGVTKGYSKQLEITGVGYKAEVRPYGLQLALGFSHQIEYKAPHGIKLLGAAADADRDRRRGQGGGGTGGRRDSRAASARAVQGQGHQVRRASRSAGKPARREASNADHVYRRRANGQRVAPPHARPREGGGHARAAAPGRVPVLKHIYAQLVDDTARRTSATVSSQALAEGKKSGSARCRWEGDRREGQGRRHHARRVRPRRVPVSRPRESGGRRRPRGRPGVLNGRDDGTRSRRRAGRDDAGRRRAGVAAADGGGSGERSADRGGRGVVVGRRRWRPWSRRSRAAVAVGGGPGGGGAAAAAGGPGGGGRGSGAVEIAVAAAVTPGARRGEGSDLSRT